MNKIRTQTHVYFMSKPGTTAADRRSYLVKIPHEFYATVFVVPTDAARLIKCSDCNSDSCKHAKAAAAIDLNKFPHEAKK